MNIHAGEKPYECNQYRRRFADPRNLNLKNHISPPASNGFAPPPFDNIADKFYPHGKSLNFPKKNLSARSKVVEKGSRAILDGGHLEF